MAVDFDLAHRFARAQADYEETQQRGYGDISDKRLKYYVETLDLSNDPQVREYLSALDTTKQKGYFDKMTAEEAKAEFGGVSELYFSDMRPIILQILLNILIHSPEYNDERKFLIKALNSNTDSGIIKQYLGEKIAPALFTEIPTQYAVTNKFGNLLSAEFVYACKTYYRETHGAHVEDMYNNIQLLYKLDDLKRKINPKQRPLLTYTEPNTTYEVDYDERESASADRCF